jgi:hypothetical protein
MNRNGLLSAFWMLLLLLGASCGSNSALPEVEIGGAANLVAFSDWRWKDGQRQQLAVDMRRLGGDIDTIRYTFYAGGESLVSDVIPGNIFEVSDQPQTRYLPEPSRMNADGTIIVPDVSRATRLVVTVEAIDVSVAVANDSPWARRTEAMCKQGSMTDCSELVSAYRNGRASEGVPARPDLAESVWALQRSIGESRCAAGEVETCFLLGVAYHETQALATVTDGSRRGVELIQQACTRRYVPACTFLEENRLPG